MQTTLDLGEDHVSVDDVLAELDELHKQRGDIDRKIRERKSQLKHIRGGVICTCAHCDAEYPYRELVFLVEERYSHTPAYEDAVYVEQNWGYRCPRCTKSSWWGHPVDVATKSPQGIRKLFKSVETIQNR